MHSEHLQRRLGTLSSGHSKALNPAREWAWEMGPEVPGCQWREVVPELGIEPPAN